MTIKFVDLNVVISSKLIPKWRGDQNSKKLKLMHPKTIF